MSHSIANEVTGNVIGIFQLTIVNYTAGSGETFTLPEFKLAAGSTVIPVVNPSSRNSLGSLIFPIYASGTLSLFRFVGGVPQEVPTTVGLNAIFDIALIVNGQQSSAF